jgi:hypothetical protein
MSILISVDAVPSRVRALVNIVANEPGILREEVIRRLRPDGEGVQEAARVYSETLRLGFIIEEEDTKKALLGEMLSKKIIKRDTDFIEACSRSLIVENLDKTDGSNYPFSRALSWLLTRPVGMSTVWGGEFSGEITKDLDGNEIYELTNSTRCQAFGYWAHFLGFMEWLRWEGATYCNPDPTRAMSGLIPKIMDKGEEIPIKTFLSKLSKEVPVFEFGSIRNEVEDRLKKPREERTISGATSLALTRLQVRGVLELSQPSDAEAWLLTDMEKKSERVSHVKFLKKVVVR